MIEDQQLIYVTDLPAVPAEASRGTFIPMDVVLPALGVGADVQGILTCA